MFMRRRIQLFRIDNKTVFRLRISKRQTAHVREIERQKKATTSE